MVAFVGTSVGCLDPFTNNRRSKVNSFYARAEPGAPRDKVERVRPKKRVPVIIH